MGLNPLAELSAAIDWMNRVDFERLFTRAGSAPANTRLNSHVCRDLDRSADDSRLHLTRLAGGHGTTTLTPAEGPVADAAHDEPVLRPRV